MSCRPIPAESEMSRQNRATPPRIKVSHLSPDPPVAPSSHLQQAGVLILRLFLEVLEKLPLKQAIKPLLLIGNEKSA